MAMYHCIALKPFWRAIQDLTFGSADRLVRRFRVSSVECEASGAATSILDGPPLEANS